MRKKLYNIINAGGVYAVVMVGTIIISLIPLASHTETTASRIVDLVATVIFLIDYALRLLTADIKLEKGAKSFLIYPFTPMAIVDLVSLLPGLVAVNHGFRLLRLVRLFRALRVLRIFKAARYSKNMDRVFRVLKNKKEPLLAVCGIAGIYVLIAALVIFNAEPDSFPTFFDALYWAVVSLTTMGYGDIYPVTTLGRIVTMISSFLGIAVVAMPASIITAGFMEVIDK